MKRLTKLSAVVLLGTMGVSCTTSFDSYGNRRQSIDPASAAIGAVALGVIAYSVGKNRGERRERREHRRHTSNHHYYDQQWDQGHQRGYQNGGRYCR